MITTIDPELISSFLVVEFGRKRTKVELNPSKLMSEIRLMAEISVVPRPICSGVNKRVQIIQNTKPKRPMTTVVDIR